MLTTIPDNFIYFGLFLFNKDKEMLKNFVMNKFGKFFNKQFEDENTKFYLEHCTIFHKNNKHQFPFKLQMYQYLNNIFEEYPGMLYKLKIIGYGHNNKAFAFQIELPDGIPYFENKVYHITIATFHRARPVESNNIINWRELNEPITVTTILKKIYNENI